MFNFDLRFARSAQKFSGNYSIHVHTEWGPSEHISASYVILGLASIWSGAPRGLPDLAPPRIAGSARAVVTTLVITPDLSNAYNA